MQQAVNFRSHHAHGGSFVFIDRKGELIMPEQNDRLIRYSMQIAFLGRLLKEKLISDYEYSLIRKKLMKDYGISSDILAGKEIAT